MSDRDDIDVKGNAEKKAEPIFKDAESANNNSSDNKINQAIRQNPLTHSDEKSSEKGIFGKLKRAFENKSNEGSAENSDVFGGIVNRFKRNKSHEIDNDNIKDNKINQNVNMVNTEPEKKAPEFDPEEEEEYQMISAFLEGEEYEPKSVEEKENVKTENETVPEAAEDKPEEKNVPEAAEDKPEKKVVSEAAEDKPEKKVVPEGAEVKPEEKNVSEGAEVKPEEKTVPEGAEVKPKEKTVSEAAEDKPEKKVVSEAAEDKPEEKTVSEGAEDKPEEKTVPEGSEDKPEEKTVPEAAEDKPEEKTVSEGAEVKPEEKTVPKAEETKPEYDVQNALENEEAVFEVSNALENEEAEFVMIDFDDDDFVDDIGDLSEDENVSKNSDINNNDKSDETHKNAKPDTNPDKSPEESKTDTKADESPEESKTDTKPDESPEESKPETNPDKSPEESKPETNPDKSPEKSKPDTKADESPEESKTDTKPDESPEESKPDTKADESPEELKPDIKPEQISEQSDAEDINIVSDEELDDDEEFKFEEEFVFDESGDDEDIEDLANLESIEEYKDLENLFHTSQTPKKEESSQSSGEAVSENSNDNKPEADSPADASADNAEQEKHKTVLHVENSNENPSEKPEQEFKEPVIDDISAEKEQTFERKDSFEDISSKSNDSLQPPNSSNGKLKAFMSKAKNKLVEMWNTKSDGTVEGVSPQIDKTNGKVIDITAAAQSGAESDYGDKPDSGFNHTLTSASDNNQSDISDISNKDENKSKIIPMSVIKNENANLVPIDKEKVRETLSVIENDKKIDSLESGEPITDEQKHQQELNQKVLEKVKQYEEETADKREELRKARAERSAKAYEKAFGTNDKITEIEITDYQDTDDKEIIKVKAGKFSESVRSEYEFYIGYTRLKNVAKQQTVVEPIKKPEEKENALPVQKSAAERPVTKFDDSKYEEFSEDKFAKSRDKLDNISKRLDFKDQKNPDRLEYRKEEDAGKIKKILQERLAKAKMQWNVSLGLTFAMFAVCLFGGLFGVGKGEEAADGKMRAFAFINLFVYAAMLYNCRDIVIRGLKPLKSFKSNCDTGYAAAAVVTALQAVLALISPATFFRQGLCIYTPIIMLALAMNCLGQQRNADRISSNFRFVSDSSQKYTGKFFHDQRMVATLLSGTRNDKSELVFQKKTSFLKHFIKLSESPDPGEDLGSKFSLPTIVFSLVVSIVYLFLSKSFFDAVSVLSIMLCAAVPMCSKALGAVPLHRLAKNSLANQSMVVGYQAVENFAESAAVMLDAKELYPEGSVHLNGIKTFDARRIDDAMHAAASVIITAGGAMAGMFDGIIQGDKRENLPTAENVIYEDGKGLIGWVNNERIFVGNRKLLESHGIEPMTEEYEVEQKANGDEILYFACAGELVAMFIVGYSANRRVADALRRMEANGMSMLIRTTDVNITAERIAKDFGISHRSIKILEQKNSNVVRDEMIGKEKSSPAFVATKGGVTSFGRAVSGCIQTKRNISLSLAVQVFGVLLGLLIVTVIALVSGVHHIGAMQMFLFYLFWVAAVLVSPMIVQRIQKY